MDIRTYLRNGCLPTREQVDAFVKRDDSSRYDRLNAGWTYDSDSGWILVDSVRADGIDGSNTFYHYEASGCRRRCHGRDSAARIHTYGDSFTHCDQVSDGETWQEVLAAHLGEPLENYGVGGYSVYQAYRRMLSVEAAHPAEYIILNVYDDDSFRNLDALRSVRRGTRSPCGFTLPHLRVDLARDTVAERQNLCPRAADVYRLTDLDWAAEQLADDPVLQVVLSCTEQGDADPLPDDVPVAFGLPRGSGRAELRQAHVRAALRATRHVLELTERFVERTGRKLFVVLSYSRGGMREALADAYRWDTELVEYLRTRPYPYLDLRDAHVAEGEHFDLDVDAYLDRYYNGHYAPAGNFFCAQALRRPLLEWLDPPPPAYQPWERVVE